MFSKQIVVLAKSYKLGGWCLAGREVELSQDKKTYKILQNWMRPVCENQQNHGALTNQQCRYGNGTAKVYDIVEIEFQEHRPAPGQPENYLINGSQWTKLASIKPQSINSFCEHLENIWHDQSQKSNCVGHQYQLNGNIGSSLCIVKPENFMITLKNDYNPFKSKHNRETRASFSYGGRQYNNISITDPAIRKKLGDQYPKPDGEAVQVRLEVGDDCHLCLSLGPALNNLHYKLVATVFDNDGDIQRTFG